MNKSILWIVVGAVVVVGGGLLLFSGPSEVNSPANVGSAINGDESETSGGTFASLLASKQSLECNFRHDDGANVTSGTVYMTSGAKRIRGDFNLEQGGQAMEGHMIRDDGYNYVWGSFFPQGIKSKVTVENEGKLLDKDDAVDEDTEFNCKPWSVNASMFALPANVTFQDISAQVEVMNEAVGDMKAQQCASCNQLPAGQGKDQCLQALGC